MRLNESQMKNLQKLNVKLVYLFGSQAEGKSLPLSDIDIGVVFAEDSLFNIAPGTSYNQLYDIFTDIYPGKKVDIIFLHKASLELRFDVISHGKILYADSKKDQLDFEEKTILFYADFKPILEEFNQAILSRSNSYGTN